MNIQQINFARKHAAYCNYYRNFAASKKPGVINQPVNPWLAAGAIGTAVGVPALHQAQQYGMLPGQGDAPSPLPSHYIASPQQEYTEELLGRYGQGPINPNISRVAAVLNPMPGTVPGVVGTETDMYDRLSTGLQKAVENDYVKNLGNLASSSY